MTWFGVAHDPRLRPAGTGHLLVCPAITTDRSPALPEKAHTRCRLCATAPLIRYLDLGVTPLANSYVPEERLGSTESAVELTVQFCPRCGLSQLTRVVDRDRMFRDYLYVSSTTLTFREHCAGLARAVVRAASAPKDALAVDIASNDGLLLSCFRSLGMRVVGVDPARELAADATARGIPTIPEYWTPDTAREIVERSGRPRMITATNVLGHVDDVHGFVASIATTLAPGGVLAIEVPYVLDLVRRNEFDTVYHEHLSYWGLHQLRELLRTQGLDVFEVERFPDIHGGTIRIFGARLAERPPSAAVASLLVEEERFGVSDPDVYRAFGERVGGILRDLRQTISDLRSRGARIWAYGASAKGNTLMNSARLTSADVPIVIDDNPKKWGLYTPGARMRITGPEELARGDVDHLLLLAWNFEREIVRRCERIGYSGRYIVPVPAITIVQGTVRA